MRVLMLSLDKKVLESGSSVQERLFSLSERAGEMTVFVPAERDGARKISPQLTMYAFGGPRPVQMWKMRRKAQSLILNHSSLTPATSNSFSGTEGKESYALITVQDTVYLAMLAYWLARRFRIPLEVQVHGFERLRGLRKWLAGFVLRRADMIRVVSQCLKAELTKRYTLNATRFYILPVYTQIEIPSARSKRKTVPVPFTFLTVGRLVTVKNISLQIRAFARLVKEFQSIRLLVVGDGPLGESLKLEVKSLKLEDKIFFEGKQKDLVKYYEEADAFLLTSDSEGWGRVVLEAAAHKLPIIMTNVGLAREVIKNEESGLIIPVGDEYELVRAMKEFLDKPELRARLGANAYKAFRALPSAPEQIAKQVEVWESFR